MTTQDAFYVVVVKVKTATPLTVVFMQRKTSRVGQLVAVPAHWKASEDRRRAECCDTGNR